MSGLAEIVGATPVSVKSRLVGFNRSFDNANPNTYSASRTSRT
jgi:hypothetical protein